MALRFSAGLWVCLLGCHRVTGSVGVESLVDLTLKLESTPTLRPAVRGSVEEFEAEISFDPSRPVSFITSKCAGEAPLLARVSIPSPFGADQGFPLCRVVGLHLGATKFRNFEAAVTAGKKCAVVLGAPELKELALEINPEGGTIRFRPSQSRAQWAAELAASDEGGQVLTLTKEPRYDWPLVSVRLRQRLATFDGPLLLSLSEPRTRLFEGPARAAGVSSVSELLSQAGLPGPPPELAKLRGYPFDSLEFAPGFGLKPALVEAEPGLPPHVAEGVLGFDAWGRFVVAYDVGSSVLVLRPLRVSRAEDSTDQRLLELLNRAIDWPRALGEEEPSDPD